MFWIKLVIIETISDFFFFSENYILIYKDSQDTTCVPKCFILGTFRTIKLQRNFKQVEFYDVGIFQNAYAALDTMRAEFH